MSIKYYLKLYIRTLLFILCQEPLSLCLLIGECYRGGKDYSVNQTNSVYVMEIIIKKENKLSHCHNILVKYA